MYKQIFVLEATNGQTMRNLNERLHNNFINSIGNGLDEVISNYNLNSSLIFKIRYYLSDITSDILCNCLIECLSDNHKKDDGMSNA
jgi:hypothetical protein